MILTIESCEKQGRQLTVVDCLTYEELSAIRERSYRNGRWRRLTQVERALYRASLGLARIRGKVVNASLLEVLSGIIDKLLRRFAEKILELGRRWLKGGGSSTGGTASSAGCRC